MNAFSEGVLDSHNGPIRYRESGSGPAIVMFPSDGHTGADDLATALAGDYHVLEIDISNTQRIGMAEFAINLTAALATLGVTSYSVVGISQGVSFALAQALHAAEATTRLVLVSPPLASVQDPRLSTKLNTIGVPTLILVGTRDRTGSREAGRLCRAQIPVCHLLLVYEAGPAIMTDRHEACLSPMREFLQQGEGFIVAHESQLIRP